MTDNVENTIESQKDANIEFVDIIWDLIYRLREEEEENKTLKINLDGK